MEQLSGTDFGLGAVVMFLLTKEVFSFVKGRKNNGRPEWCRGCGWADGKSEHQLKDLWEWHKPDPETGRFRWYERDSEIIAAIMKVGEDMVREMRELRRVWKNGR